MIYLNNKIVPAKNARISVFDRGFLYGDGVYESLRVYQGVVFQLDEHVNRLFRSASMIGMTIPKSHAKIRQAVYETVRANRHREAYVRITVSRGAGSPGLDPALSGKPTFVVFSRRLKPYPPEHYMSGVKIAIVDVRRNLSKALNPKIKSLNFLNNILAKIDSLGKGAYEAVMLNHRGHVAEGTVTNVFFVVNDVLCTPSVTVGILDGITRQIILRIAKDLRIRTREGRFTRQDLYGAKEIFISNSTMEVMPVTEVDGKRIGIKAGSLTKTIHRCYRDTVSDYIRLHKQNGLKDFQDC